MNESIIDHQIGIDPHYKIWHTTDRHMIIYMYSQGGSIVCSEKSYPIEKGILCFVGAGKYHYTMPDDPGTYDRSKMFLSTQGLRNLLSLLPADSPFHKVFTPESFVYARISEVEQREVEQLFRQLADVNSDDVCFPATLYSCFLRMMSYLFHNALESTVPVGGLMHGAVAYINSHIQENLCIDDICAAVHSSKYHFCRRFKIATGLTVMEYILKTRIVLAKSMLVNTTVSVGEISESCGFSSISYFCRMFKKDTGKTPMQYRKNRDDKKT